MFKKYNFKKNIKALSPFIKPYKWAFLFAIIMIVITNFMMTLAPTIEGMVTSQLASDAMDIYNQVEHAGVNFDKIIQIGILLLIIYSIKTIAQMLSVRFLCDSIQNAMHDLRNAVQNKIRRLPVRYFDNHQFGDVLSRITNDIDAVSNALQQSFNQVISGILTLVFAISMMLMINVTMTLITLLIIPLSLIISKVIVSHSQSKFKAQQKALGELNGAITEMYTGFNEIILYNKQAVSIHKFRALNENLRKNAFNAQFMSSTMSPMISLVTYLIIGTIGVVGTSYAIEGIIMVGSLQAFVRYIWQINDPITQVSQLSSQIQSAFAAMGRVFEILNEEEEIKEVRQPIKLNPVYGNVSFEHVAFSYHQEALIKDLNIEVKSGQMVAIVGPTGAGKTTLINLLMRFYDVLGGSIKIDGVDIRDMKREDLRSIFGMVLQDTWLFSGTIYDNIRYGRLNARKDEVIAAAKTANVHHFIRTLPDGYDMFINEEGSNISQGEKQLLTIARAILKDPQILILDEATSSVDTRLELMLQEAMKNIMKGRTSFVIAHRLSTIRSADLILVINEGDIVESGTHDELISKKGFYEKLYNSQFAKNANSLEE
ncbi:MAG: ABC transporter ATP-binding protein [Erysipelotrichaceae bacterium]